MRNLMLGLTIVAISGMSAMAGEYNKKVSIGDKAPAFTGIPAWNPVSGEDASLSLPDVKEDVVVIVFLGNHCPVVQAYEDRLIDFTEAYKGKSVKVIGVAVNDMDADRLPAIKDYTKDKGSNYVYGFDETQEIGRNYGATNTPQFFVLDSERMIRYMGSMDDNMNEAQASKQYLRDAVDSLLAGKDIATKETRPVGCGVKYKR